ncbi:MAG: hypothetical protein HKO76_07910, partial [Acidimicrobiia bacterium]|nr:hypothetical protein [Acidimicrobiia bacterium]
MGLELIRWKSNERVGLPDQEAMSDLLLEEMIREKGELVLRDTQGARVFGGFLLTDLGAGLARLDQGRAVMKVLKDQVESHGFFLGLQSPTSYQLDFSGAADDTYDVYIRAAYTDATFENRVFWSPSASAEVVDYTATRQRVTWEATYVADSAASPGSEWVRVWSVTVASGAITGTTDRRPFYFEGDPVTTFGLQWGDGATDRNADRASYGAQDRWTWDQAVRRQIADIIGSPVGAHTFWPVAPIELTQLAAEHYAEADGSGQRGKHKTINFGATGQFWQLSAAAADSAFISATEETTNTPHLEMEMGEFGGGPNRKVLLRLEPYGGLGGQNVGDFAGTAEFGGEVSCVTSYTAVNTYITTWNRLTQDVMRLDVGAALPEEGLHILSGATYSDEGFRADSGEFLI